MRPSEIRPGIRRLFRLDRHREADDEIRLHLQLRVDQLIQEGLLPDAARDEAIRRFGSIEDDCMRFRESAKRIAARVGFREWIDGARLDLRYAIRSLRHDLAFTTFAMLIVGLGVGACAIVFSLMDGVSLRPLPFNDPSRLVRISSVADDGTSEWRRSVAPQVLPLRELLLSPPSLSPEESRNARRALMLLTGAGLLVQSFPAFAGCQARFPTPRRRGDAMRHVMHVLAPDQPVELLSPLPALVAAERAQPLFQARLIAAFSLLGLVLAAIGMYSTVAYSVTHRMRELGIRLALGVRPRASSVSCRVASRRVAVRCSRSSASPRASRPGGVHRSRSPCNANRSNCAAPGDLIDTAWVLAA